MQQEMKYVYQVYLDGSFSKAAEHLYMTQPALSIAVQKLECGLGMPVFDRRTRPLSLTAPVVVDRHHAFSRARRPA